MSNSLRLVGCVSVVGAMIGRTSGNVSDGKGGWVGLGEVKGEMRYALNC
jgi:hypothetical protein